MFKKLALTLALALVAVLAAVSSASAVTYTKSLKVLVSYQAFDGCMAASDLLSYRLNFAAQVEAVGVTAPTKVRVSYQLFDKTDKTTRGSGALNLRESSGFQKSTRRIYVPAGHKMSYRLKMSYHVEGKVDRVSKRFTDQIPTTGELADMALPSC